MPEQKNLILAIVLSLAVIVGFEFLWPKPQNVALPTATEATVAGVPAPDAAVPGSPQPAVDTAKRVADVLAGSARVKITTPSLTGSINLTGARFDDLTLTQYRETTKPDSPQVTLLRPSGTAEPYFAEFGFVPGEGAGAVPGRDTVWQADSETLTPDSPVMLLWDNGQGLVFKRVISVDANFMFTVTDTVENTGTAAATVFPYGLINRGYTPMTADFYILHEGPLGVFNGTLKETKYIDLKDEKSIEHVSTGGWMGITDKYWLTALDLDNATESKTRFLYLGDAGDRYQVDYLGAAQQVAPGQSVSLKHDFFAGAKVLELLDAYSSDLSIDKFDLAIDFGWFFFLTKPFFHALTFLHGILGNFGLAILALTVVVKLIMFPLANKSYRSMSRMKLLQPEVKKLQERFADDKQRMQQEMMALYKSEKVNPLGGCLPIVIQIPVFFALYKVLFVSIEMRHAPFYGWIKDLSAPDPTTLFNLFGAIPWDPPSFMMIGVWPLIMGVTMYLQQKLNPAPADPMQARIMMFLPVMFTFMLASFPAGLVIYWAWNNSLSIAQQWAIMRGAQLKPVGQGTKPKAKGKTKG